MNLYGLFILGVNIKYLVFSILYRHINVPMACKELIRLALCLLLRSLHKNFLPSQGSGKTTLVNTFAALLGYSMEPIVLYQVSRLQSNLNTCLWPQVRSQHKSASNT